jgi:DDE superfamily endonuclease
VHRSDEFLKFLKQVAKAYPRVKLHLVMDNYATHKHPQVQAWLTRNPRITMHFTPTSGSWLNMVEIWQFLTVVANPDRKDSSCRVGRGTRLRQKQSVSSSS